MLEAFGWFGNFLITGIYVGMSKYSFKLGVTGIILQKNEGSAIRVVYSSPLTRSTGAFSVLISETENVPLAVLNVKIAVLNTSLMG